MNSILWDEIQEQPQMLHRVVQEAQTEVNALIAAIHQRDIRYVVLVARGTSDNAAEYAKYLLQIVCGVPVALAAPSVHTLWGATVNYRNALVIGISQSGRGEDVNEVMTQAKTHGALTVAITNSPDAPLAQIAEHVLHCRAGDERAVAATKSYTTTLALIALLAARWGKEYKLADSLMQIDTVAQTTLTNANQSAFTVAQTLFHAERILTVARGLHLPTAVEAALKIAETTYTTTQAFSSADLLHGPIASVGNRTPCLLFVPNGFTVGVMNELTHKLTGIGARVIRLTTVQGDIPLIDPGTELLSPLVDILPAQLLAYHLTVARGLDPDNPHGLSKVTITR